MTDTTKPAQESASILEGTPKRIYLQTGGGDGCTEHFDQLGEVTWCGDPQEQDDTEYIRADIHEQELDALRAEVAALKSGDMVMVPREPSEKMVDAPRQIILYSETRGRSLEGLRAHLVQSGVDYLRFFPVWATRDCGHLTKAGIAILVYAAMLAAAEEERKDG